MPDLPGLQVRGRTPSDVEIALPRAIAAALPAKAPPRTATLAWVAPAGREAAVPPRLPLEAARAARRAIRDLLAGAARVPVDLAHRLLFWDRDLAQLEPFEPAPEPRAAGAPMLDLFLEELPSDEGQPETIVLGRDADGREVAIYVLDDEEP